MADVQRPTKKQLQKADDYHAMKAFYYDRYMSQLRDKILELDNKQVTAPHGRKSSSKSNSERQKVSSKQSANKKDASDVRKLFSNNPLSVSPGKSARLSMLEVEQKLIQAGYLKSDDEISQFRSGVAVAEDLIQYAEEFVAKKQLVDSQRKVASRKNHQRPLSRITETRENSANKSRPATRGIPKKQMDTDLNPLGGNKNISPADIGRAAAAALEKRCPRMDVPDLHCLRPEPDDLDGEAEIALNEQRGRRRDEYTTQISYLRQMYQRAQANSAQSKRIIDARDDDILQHDRKSKLVSDLTQLCEMISPKTRLHDDDGYMAQRDNYDATSSTYDPAYDVPDLSDTDEDNLLEMQQQRINNWREDNHQPANVISTSRKQFDMFTPIEEESSTPRFEKSSPVYPSVPPTHEHHHDNALVPIPTVSDDSAVTDSQQSKMLAIKDGKDTSLPLKLNQMESELKTLESKSMSTYWSNYLKAGKSKFAREDSLFKVPMEESGS